MTRTTTNQDLEVLRNRSFDEIAVGDRADPRESRIASCAVALVAARRAARGPVASEKPALEAIAS